MKSMSADPDINAYLSKYDEKVRDHGLKLREILHANLPGIIEQIDLPAKMIAYGYGQKYIEMICCILPSKKGLKLAFYKGVDLPDPDHLLEGTAKISRYVEIKSATQIYSAVLKQLIESALAAYTLRIENKDKSKNVKSKPGRQES